MAAHRAPPSLGFSRQEHWSGLPFPSPMHESEKWKWSRSVVSDSQRLQPTRLLRPLDFPGKGTGMGCYCLLHIKHLTELLFCRSYFSSHWPGLKWISPVPKLFFPSPPPSLVLLLYFSSPPISLYLWSRVTHNGYCLRRKRLKTQYIKTYVVTVIN